MRNYTQSLPPSAQKNPDQIWNNYISDQLQWLKHFYQKTNAQNIDQKLKEVRKLFEQLKSKIKKSQFNKDNKYFNNFAKLQQQKWFRKKIQFKGGDLEQDVLKLKDMLYKNHIFIIQFLSRQRFTFKYIAKHIFRGKQNQPSSFKFDVEKGLTYGKHYSFRNKLIFYMFVRDVANAIIQLQKHGIFHVDIALRNILLFNCSIGQLQNYSEFVKEENKIRFKFIDFDNAFFMSGLNFGETRQILELKKKLKSQNLQSSGILLSIIERKNNLEQLSDGLTYKKFHSQSFKYILYQICHNQKESKFQISGELYNTIQKMIMGQQYSELISQMGRLIQNQVK